jgi:quercetin dioxygenase-like cupin family protein
MIHPVCRPARLRGTGIGAILSAALALALPLGLPIPGAQAAETTTAPAAPAAAQPAAPMASQPAATDQTTAEPPIKVNPLVSEKLPNVPGNTLTAVQVVVEPGASMPAHHHAGFVYAYVLSGKIRSQLGDGKARTYKTGQSWTEPPGSKHAMFENASKKKRAKVLAVFVAPDGAQLTTMDK